MSRLTSRLRLVGAALALLSVAACSTGGVVGGAAGAAGGYAVDGRRGAIIGGLGGAALGTALDH
ncbi:hypothetical protein [Azospirillum agricola]|uniref:hypothetical protein n=1 Tax=Azospirillum agricola TaxID=1720247 RepID=UPI000A0EF21E|nr:hypothetical protein [Azospirillum agricola]MBP2227262.1 outer membrane lipoprotein SlyB [Azospirillum agricola]SMH60139.1 hypothetical protein SAMN02982994_5356 [Azospirillum lipoferum]